jgi:hypothetical protein
MGFCGKIWEVDGNLVFFRNIEDKLTYVWGVGHLMASKDKCLLSME